MSTLADRIQEALDDTGAIAADLARACGVKPPSVSAWLSGDTKSLKSSTAIRAAEFLKVNQLWLTEGRGPKRPEGGAAALPEPESAEPTVADLLERLRAEISTQPEAVKRAIAELVTEYVTTPDASAGKAVADAILRILGPRT
ncbi:helix-turn-helix domain-containing protein [Thauera aromatica]|nr:helix-turn-helix domain-containing protein [Thauera aromatica]